MSELKNYLELVRIPGVFTAHADILAGALIAGAGFMHLPELVLLLIASSLLFSAGMALNDYFDREVDNQERPERPIPSGRIKKETAFFSGIAMLVAGVFIPFFVGSVSFVIALLLALSILLYDWGLKKNGWAGPINMGLCRYLNLLLGISILPLNVGAVWIPMLTWIYIAGISVLSGSEVSGGDLKRVVICLLCIVGVTALYWIFGALSLLRENPGLFFCLIWMGGALFFPLRLFSRATPKDYQVAIKMLLLLLVILDGVIVIGVRSIPAGLLVFIIIIPSIYISRRFYVT